MTPFSTGARFVQRSETGNAGEIRFGLWFKKTFREQLLPSDDWYSRSRNVTYEIKDLTIPSTRPLQGNLIRLNAESLRLKKRQGTTVVVLMFSDGVMKSATLEQVEKGVRSVSNDLTRNSEYNRPCLMVDLSVFREGLVA